MNPVTIDYGSSPRSRCWSRWVRRGGALVALAAGLIVLTSVTVSERTIRIDAVTGTVRTRTTWPLGISSGAVVDVSPLETRLKASGVTWVPDWRFLSDNGRTILGSVTYRGCSTAPPIYSIRPVLKGFADASTDAELREFVRVMQAGTPAEQAAAVEGAGETGLGAMERGLRK